MSYPASLFPAYGQVPVAQFTTPAVDPNEALDLEGSQQLESQETQDEISQLNEQMMVEHLNSENSIRTAIQAAMHAIANQAESLSQQFIGDEIAQVKKGLENAGKAV